VALVLPLTLWYTGPPLAAGASRTCTPRASSASLISVTAAGELLVMSIHVVPRRSQAAAPPGPAISARTSPGPGRTVIKTSASAASLAASGTHRAPHRAACRLAWGRRSAASTR
jgi:hypothetical protein